MVTTYRRTTFPLFQLANNAYKNASVTFYEIDPDTYEATDDLATIYDSPVGGSALANPYTLGSTGKATNIIYFDTPVIAVINATDIGQHETGIIYPRTGDYRGDWATDTLYLPGQIVKDGENGSDTGNLYVVVTEHTSGTFATDVSNGDLELMLDVDLAVTSAAAASASATAASGSASSASSSASSASTSASNASTSETNAAASEAAAAVSAASLADFRFFTTTGSSNTYVGDLTPNATLSDGAVFRLEVNHTNTGAVTLNIDGTGAKSVRKFYNSVLASGDWVAGSFQWVMYDAANDWYQLLTLPSQATTAALNDLSDVTAASPSTNDFVVYTGSGWENRSASQCRTHLGLTAFATATSIDVSDLSTGTDGELITWDSGGNPTTVAAGSVGDILTSQGAGAEPVFQAPFTVTAGTGLTGGGQLTGNITVDIDVGTGADQIPQINGSGILTGQTIQEWILLLAVRGSAINETVTVIDGAPFAFTFKTIRGVTDSGTIVATTSIGATPLGGGGTTAAATPADTAHASANSVSAGDKVSVALTSNSSAVDVFIYAKIERAL